MKYKLLSVKQCDRDQFYAIITLETVPNWIESFFTKPKQMRFRGSGTVWNLLPHMKRCSLFMEGMLTQIWQRAVYEGTIRS